MEYLWRAEGKGGSALTLGLEPEDLSGVPLGAPGGGVREGGAHQLFLATGMGAPFPTSLL